MELIPAIDILGGKVVRLSKGDLKTAKSYENFQEPLQTAKKWESDGAKSLHIVDLDAAMGQGDNLQIIEQIMLGVRIPVQVGGGIRSSEKATKMLNAGINRIIVTTLAFEKEDVLKTLLQEFGSHRIMVALDYLEETVMAKGWRHTTGLSLMKAIQKFLNLGIEFFLLTSISRDGLLRGPDYPTLNAVTQRFKKKLFVAGGISTLNDLIQLKSIGVEGVVIGKALYEGNFSLKDALKALGE
ncbi:MAG: 1-(5-phosphoribosyl)-5-[(5-phosphoribosylamino)methylideneamino]imidazole-4-carboxamide isomerase [Candidatus Bathyarchaeota archaeon]